MYKKIDRSLSMTCDLLLINPPISMEERYGEFAELGSRVPPLGLCSIAAVVRQAGFRVKIIDAPALNIDHQEVINLAREEQASYTGITAVTNSIISAYALAVDLKSSSKESKIIIGGPHITALPEETFRECADLDIGIIGEGEITVIDILSGKNLKNIPGIIFRENGVLCQTQDRTYIEELDALPFPAWDLLPQLETHYRPSPHSYLRLPSSSLITSRGCSGKCTFCVRSLSGKKYRAHSADYTIAMVEHLVHTYKIRDIIFYDDNFLLDKKRAIDICEQMLHKNFKISWSCLARPEIISTDILKLLKRSGCWQIAYGIESGDQRILDMLKKQVRLEKVEDVLRKTVEAGIRTRGYFMLGVPGETEESIEKTAAFARRAYLKDFHVTFFTPFPGSEIFSNATQYGDYTRDWNTMSAWSPVFVPHGLTREKLIAAHRRMYRRFYFRPRTLLDYGMRLAFNPDVLFPTVKAGIKVFKYSFFTTRSSAVSTERDHG